MDITEIQQEVVTFRIEGAKLYSDYSQRELENYKNAMEHKFAGKTKRSLLNPENRQINFESFKIIPKLATKQIEQKVASAEKCLEYSFKL